MPAIGDIPINVAVSPAPRAIAEVVLPSIEHRVEPVADGPPWQPVASRCERTHLGFEPLPALGRRSGAEIAPPGPPVPVWTKTVTEKVKALAHCLSQLGFGLVHRQADARHHVLEHLVRLLRPSA